jgi:hypothetical protein
MRLLLVTLLFAGLWNGCAAPDAQPTVENPPAPGFKTEASDPEAIRIADEVMKAMGGRSAWDQTRYIGWNFFGSRYLIWDKTEQRVRIESEADSFRMVLDLKEQDGLVWKNGRQLEHPDSLAKYLDQARRIWINDSYWLVMPFKLKDSGVTLAYLGRDSTEADRLQLTFDAVGVTPQNKYELKVNPESRLITEWTFYPNATDSLPRFTTVWENYQLYGSIQLSDSRGPDYSLAPVFVWDVLPESVFTDLSPVRPERLGKE